MKHITKQQFNEHGWKKGDKVRVLIDGKRRVARVHSLALDGGAFTLAGKNVNTMIFGIDNILEIIPKKEKKQ